MSEPKNTETRLRELEVKIASLLAHIGEQTDLAARLAHIESTVAAMDDRLRREGEAAFKYAMTLSKHLDVHNNEIDDHEKRLKFIFSGMESLQELAGRIGNRTGREAESQHKFAMTLDADVKSLTERLTHLELTLFPKSADGFSQVFKIIGSEPTLRNNPLDRKKN